MRYLFVEEHLKGRSSLDVNRDYLAASLVAFGSIIYNAGFIYTNERKIHPIFNGLARGLTLYVITLVYCSFKGLDLTFKSQYNFKWLSIRNTIMVIQALCFSWSMYYLPLPIAFTINASSPLFVAVLDRFLFGVKPNKVQVIWLLVAFMGVILTVNGNKIMSCLTHTGQNNSSSFQNYLSRDPRLLTIVGIVFTLATCGHGFGSVLTKRLKNVGSMQINYFQSMLVIIFSSLLAPQAFADQTYNTTTMSQLGWIILFTGLPTSLGAICHITALTITKNYAVVTPFMFSGIVVGYLVSILRYNQTMNFICLVGSLVIIIGIIAILRSKKVSQGR